MAVTLLTRKGVNFSILWIYAVDDINPIVLQNSDSFKIQERENIQNIKDLEEISFQGMVENVYMKVV